MKHFHLYTSLEYIQGAPQQPLPPQACHLDEWMRVTVN